MDKDKIIELLDKYLNGQCTPQERLWIDKLYNDRAEGETIPEQDVDFLAKKQQTFLALQQEELRLRKRFERKKVIRRSLSTAAAILALIAISGALYQLNYKNQHPGGSPQNLRADISPAGHKATLTLANGKQINLDDAHQGAIANAAGVTISKTDSGRIVYSFSGQNKVSATAEQTNVITTPRGGQYELVLEDGTKIWLNADSKLSFPATFKDLKERKVLLSGEAYFEVTHNPGKPFSVESADQLVTVHGTHFNVSCYPNEPLKTTLAEGSVEVIQPKTGARKSLKPGNQSQVTIDGILVKDVNPDDIIAWKDDLFVFIQTPLPQALAEIARWYNVDIDYTKIPDENFDGEISRRLPLSQVLNVIEISTHIKLQRSGRSIKAL